MGEGTIEYDSAERRWRVYSKISYAVLLLGIGLPLWWETTAVPRASVPYSAINELDEHELRLHAHVYLGCLDAERCEELAVELLRRLTDAGQSDIYRMSMSHFGTGNTSIARAKKLADLDKAVKGFDLNHGDTLLLEAPGDVLGEDKVHVSSARALYFSEKADGGTIAQVMRQWILRDAALRLTRDALASPTKFSLDVENRRRFPASPSYDVLLSIVNPDPEAITVDRNLSRIAQEYIEPFLDELSLIADFSVKSQWLYLLPLGVKPKQVPDWTNKDGRHYALPEEILPHIITPLEKKLASQVSLHPTINLVAYIVPCEGGPLHIYARNGRRMNKDQEFEAFHSPRWGGIALVNPPADFCEQTKDNQVFTPKEQTTIGVFLAQLRLLLGITDKEPIEGASIAPMEGLKPRAWELDDLLRIKSVEQLTSARLTLQSLARLLREISNIVITEQVGSRISSALALIQISTKLLNDGDLMNGFIASKRAFTVAEAAFTDPSLLALLYFPDDQKYAVYIPLFLPVLIPVLMSLMSIKNYLFCSD